MKIVGRLTDKAFDICGTVLLFDNFVKVFIGLFHFGLHFSVKIGCLGEDPIGAFVDFLQPELIILGIRFELPASPLVSFHPHTQRTCTLQALRSFW